MSNESVSRNINCCYRDCGGNCNLLILQQPNSPTQFCFLRCCATRWDGSDAPTDLLIAWLSEGDAQQHEKQKTTLRVVFLVARGGDWILFSNAKLRSMTPWFRASSALWPREPNAVSGWSLKCRVKICEHSWPNSRIYNCFKVFSKRPCRFL